MPAGAPKVLEVAVDPATKQTLVTGLAQLPLHSAADLGRLLERCGGAFVAGAGASRARARV